MSEFNNVSHIETDRSNEVFTDTEIDKRLIELHSKSFDYHGASVLHVEVSDDLVYELSPYGLDWSQTGRDWAYKLRVFSRVANGFALEEFETHRFRSENSLGMYSRISQDAERKRTKVTPEEADEIDGIFKQVVNSQSYHKYIDECDSKAAEIAEKKANRIHRKVGRAVASVLKK